MKYTFILLQLCVLFMFVTCKKEEKDSGSKNTLTYGGNTYTYDILAEETQFKDQDCMSYNSSGGIIYIQTPGIRLNFYNNDIQLTLDLFGESAGKYSKVSAFCNEFQFKNSSLIRSRDNSKVEFIRGESELEITKKSYNSISGNFKIRVNYDENFLKDSFITGKFENITLKEKL